MAGLGALFDLRVLNLNDRWMREDVHVVRMQEDAHGERTHEDVHGVRMRTAWGYIQQSTVPNDDLKAPSTTIVHGRITHCKHSLTDRNYMSCVCLAPSAALPTRGIIC